MSSAHTRLEPDRRTSLSLAHHARPDREENREETVRPMLSECGRMKARRKGGWKLGIVGDDLGRGCWVGRGGRRPERPELTHPLDDDPLQTSTHNLQQNTLKMSQQPPSSNWNVLLYFVRPSSPSLSPSAACSVELIISSVLCLLVTRYVLSNTGRHVSSTLRRCGSPSCCQSLLDAALEVHSYPSTACTT